MHYIKAPFNFVAVSNKVFFPWWANQISHDVPFSDGLSGQLKIELTAETPIFIRDSKEITRFCHVKDRNETPRFFIPGTSLKGTIRSVLEILSFAKMDKINDHKYAIRDLHNPGVYNLMKDSQNIRCGWLRLEKDENGKEAAHIRDCDTPWRINHAQLDAEFRTSFVDTFKEGGTADFSQGSNKTAKFKYNLFGTVRLTQNFKKTTNIYGKQLCDFDMSGKSGTLVFTGQAGARKTTGRPSGKFYEFVFIEQTNPASIEVSSKIWKEFKFHYFDHDPKNISPDWKWRKGQLEKGNEIPVFFRLDSSASENAKDLGLAYLYKMPYKYSVKELLPEEHNHGFFIPDLAECIFGSANETDALKGRVQFSAAWADMATTKEDSPRTTILGTPKASYYPVYIKQTGNNGRVNRSNNRPSYKTYMDSNAKLAGWKRYPVRENARGNLPHGTDTMNVRFTPLSSGAKFTAKINYFNLRPAELGALLSALTFHNNAKECYHGLGMAKPYGFGRVALTIADDGNIDQPMAFYLSEFESEINAYMKVEDPTFEWHQSVQIKEFIAMAKVQKVEDRLTYMKLSKFVNEFAEAKKRENGFYLENYSSLSGDSNGVDSLMPSEISEDKKNRAKQMREQLKEKINNLARGKEFLKKRKENEDLLEKAEKEQRVKAAEITNRQERLAREKEAEQKRLQEERLKQEAIKNDIEKQNREEQERIAERNKRLKDSGLEPLIQNISDFQKARKIIDQYMKYLKIEQLDERDISAVMKKVSIWYSSTPDKKKVKRWKPTKGPDWKKIVSWIGDNRAEEWYNNLMKEE